MDMKKLIHQAEALKDRKIDEMKFEEAAEIRDLLITIKKADSAAEKLERLLKHEMAQR